MNEHRGRSVSRRSFLLVAGCACLKASAGCLDRGRGDAEVPAPISLTTPKTCDACGMVIEDQFGPNAQIYFAGDHPPDRDGPAWFDSVREAFEYLAEWETRGERSLGTYVTDYSIIPPEIVENDDTQYVAGSIDGDTFVDAAAATYVVNAPVVGAMGPDYLPFSTADDAASFVERHGGHTVAYASLLE